ncbi:glutathione S-transferase T1-like [Senna tora]|uniref:glutathione transferase n=1 Tax=Senna tora TaxID=362788 RepID=A0A834T5R2_9FABA|nr:glutathione S-transferase T1-like [Senna tora]
MKLKVYADRLSQPSRAVIIFCKVNGIEFEEIEVELIKRQQFSPEFKAINPLRKVPAIVDGRFKLFESHAILIYLTSAFPGVADHWYPADLSSRAKINSVLSWYHLNLRRGAATFVLHTLLAPSLGLRPNQQAAEEAEKILSSSLSTIENIWLKGNGRFLLGGWQPSIADLSLVCEITQLELLDEKDRDRVLGPHKKVQHWIESTRNATRPHFDEVHDVLHKLKTKLRMQQPNPANSETEPRIKATLTSKMLNGLDFEEIKVDISRRQHLSPEFKEISPMQKVPAIVHGNFKLIESHAILGYLASAFPGVANHWYPTDLFGRAKINSVLDWHHSNLRHGAVTYVINTVLAPAVGRPLNPKAAAEAEKVLLSSLSKIENIWLNGDGGFLLGGFQPSIADLSLVCELMQLEVLDEKDRSRILAPYKKVLQWIENTRTATNPHFDEVHNILYKAKKKFQDQRSRGANTGTEPNNKMGGLSKM